MPLRHFYLPTGSRYFGYAPTERHRLFGTHSHPVESIEASIGLRRALTGVAVEQMLKITLHDTPGGLNFQLEGRLVGPWVAELEQCWRTAASIRDGRRAVIDLKDVTFIDDSGKKLLSKLRNEGGTFVARDAMTKAIVEEVTGGWLLNPDPGQRIETVGVSKTSAHNAARSREAAFPARKRE